MGRIGTDEGKRVAITAKVSEDTADAIDLARGSLSRSEWLRQLIEQGLAGTPAGRPEPAALESLRASRREDCPHPKARVHKGFCGACGTNVTSLQSAGGGR